MLGRARRPCLGKVQDQRHGGGAATAGGRTEYLSLSAGPRSPLFWSIAVPREDKKEIMFLTGGSQKRVLEAPNPRVHQARCPCDCAALRLRIRSSRGACRSSGTRRLGEHCGHRRAVQCPALRAPPHGTAPAGASPPQTSAVCGTCVPLGYLQYRGGEKYRASATHPSTTSNSTSSRRKARRSKGHTALPRRDHAEIPQPQPCTPNRPLASNIRPWGSRFAK